MSSMGTCNKPSWEFPKIRGPMLGSLHEGSHSFGFILSAPGFRKLPTASQETKRMRHHALCASDTLVRAQVRSPSLVSLYIYMTMGGILSFYKDFGRGCEGSSRVAGSLPSVPAGHASRGLHGWGADENALFGLGVLLKGMVRFLERGLGLLLG